MNKNRRKRLTELMDELHDLKDELEILTEEEEEYLDSIPENLQGSEKYEKAEGACDSLRSAVDTFDEVLSYIEDAIT